MSFAFVCWQQIISEIQISWAINIRFSIRFWGCEKKTLSFKDDQSSHWCDENTDDASKLAKKSRKYCCGQCQGFKRAVWPKGPKGPFVNFQPLWTSRRASPLILLESKRRRYGLLWAYGKGPFQTVAVSYRWRIVMHHGTTENHVLKILYWKLVWISHQTRFGSPFSKGRIKLFSFILCHICSASGCSPLFVKSAASLNALIPCWTTPVGA